MKRVEKENEYLSALHMLSMNVVDMAFDISAASTLNYISIDLQLAKLKEQVNNVHAAIKEGV